MRRSLVVLGGTGDLAGRLLLPSLAHLVASGSLAEDVEIRVVSQEDWDAVDVPELTDEWFAKARRGGRPKAAAPKGRP